MNIRHTFYLGLVIVLIAAGSVVAYKWGERHAVSDRVVSPVAPPVQPPAVALPVQAEPEAPAAEQEYENEFMKLTVPPGWRLTELTQTLQDQTYNKATGLTAKTGEPVATPTGAVTITKGNYILYIHPNAAQASGVTGGRFAEIAMGAPSADAVVTEQPSPPCGQTVNGKTIRIPGVVLTRKDLYVSSADKKDYCAVPAKGTAWYFSYVTDHMGGYINYYKAGVTPGYVITMAYTATKPDLLPAKGSPELEQALADMTGIVQTLQLKGWEKIAR